MFGAFAEALETEKKMASQTDTVETYESAFERIREITGETDMDRLIKRFVECEDKNFALFNFVNEQNNELDALSEQIQNVLLFSTKFLCFFSIIF